MGLTETAIRSWLIENIDITNEELKPETKLFSSGLLDSFTLMDMVLFIEKSAGIKVKATELTLGNMDSVKNILTYVAGKTA